MKEKIDFIKNNWLNHMPRLLEVISDEHKPLKELMYNSYHISSRDLFEDIIPFLKDEAVDIVYQTILNINSTKK